jgi:hypothetical protein
LATGAVRGQWLTSPAIGDQLDGREHTRAANLPDAGMAAGDVTQTRPEDFGMRVWRKSKMR